MHFTVFASSPEDIKQCAAAAGVKEVLLEPELLARQGRLSADDAQELAASALKSGLRPVLVWDILMTERVMLETCRQLEAWDLGLFNAARVHDLGAAHWILKKHPKLGIQLPADIGNNNLRSLLAWHGYFGPRLDRVILPVELPEGELTAYIRALPVPCEILGAGPIQIFYSPRPLLSAQGMRSRDTAQVWIESELTAVEPQLRPFCALETGHGTMLFLDQDFFILDRLQSLRAEGLEAALVDLRRLHESQSAEGIRNICDLCHDGRITAADWPRPATARFFEADSRREILSELMPKLSRQKINGCLAEVLSFQKQRYCAFLVHQDFESGEPLVLHLPTGGQIDCRDLVWRSIPGEILSDCRKEQVVWTSWIPGISAGAVLCKGHALNRT